MAEQPGFDRCVDHLIEPALAHLRTELSDVASLGAPERAVLHAATRAVLLDTVSRKITRLLLVELKAAGLAGLLVADDSAGRWQEFIDYACGSSFWTATYQNYPTLQARLHSLVAGRCAATLELANRFGTDRPLLTDLLPGGDDELAEVSFGFGDSHRGGRTVAMVRTRSDAVVYKPRSLAIDRELATLLDELLDPGFAQEPGATRAPVSTEGRIRVPRVVSRYGYGWAEHIDHRYCASSAELATYYTSLGHWLAVAKLLGATDLHAENLIAHGQSPVLVDCETLFSVTAPRPASGYGRAVDRAAGLLADTVLQSGLLPGRGTALGWRGADVSAAGALPGQQPPNEVACLIDAGTDQARLGVTAALPMQPTNQPSPQPQLRQHWPRVLAGFEELTARLAELDSRGDLSRLLQPFRDVEVRAVLRATESYAELARMLWHPASLHDEPAAIRRAADLLVRHGHTSPPAPTDPAVVQAEIADLLVGDIPFFHTCPSVGQLSGPGGTSWSEPADLVEHALDRWRAADLRLDREVIRSTLVSAYLNEGWDEPGDRLQVAPTDQSAEATERLRRQLAADLVTQLISTAIPGEDGTVTWIAPTLSAVGWGMHPLGTDLYSGSSGIAVLLAGYQQEVAGGRALPADGVTTLLAQVMHGIRLAERVRAREATGEFRTRPEPPGLYTGLGSGIWSRLLLAELGAAEGEGLASAVELARLLPGSLTESAEPDLLVGSAGSIIALMRLAEVVGDPRWLQLAESVGEQLIATGHRVAGTLHWRSARAPEGLGGFAHGSTGIGWALARLGSATGRAEFAAAADAAFAFEHTLWQPATGSWLDARGLGAAEVTTGWCHGAAGIGLASLDLLTGDGVTDHASVVRRAAAACWPRGMGRNHSLCHGDLACWELLARACDGGLGPPGMDRADLDGYLLASLAQHGPVTGTGRDVFSPGLLPGLAGIAYQLLRMHPDCGLPSVLMPSC